jgi:hypothetical protein
VAKGLEVARRSFYFEALPKGESEERGLVALTKEYGDLEPPEKKLHKSWVRTAGAYLYYLDEFPLGEDPLKPFTKHSGIEFTFAIPLPYTHPDTGDPLVFGGRFDVLGEFNKGLYGLDDKTCSELGPTWSSKWSLRGQFLGYCWAADQCGLKLNGFIVRGLCMYKNDFAIGQAIEQFPPWILKEWETQLYEDIEEMLGAYKRHSVSNHSVIFPKNFGDSCTAYGGCPYRDLCRRQNPEPWIESAFVERIWNPLDKGE